MFDHQMPNYYRLSDFPPIEGPDETEERLLKRGRKKQAVSIALARRKNRGRRKRG